MERRSFLRNSALALTGAISATSILSSCKEAAVSTTSATSKEFIGLQTYSLGQELTENVPAGLARIKAAGYTDLELAGYTNGQMAGMPVLDFKKLCDDNGLKITSSHLGDPSSYQTPEADFTQAWKKTCEDHAAMGCKWAVDPSMPTVNTHEEAKLIGDRFNLAGRICKEYGLQFGYHNHSGEFKRIATEEQKEAAVKAAIAQVKRQFPQYDISEEQIRGMMEGGMGLFPAAGDSIEELFIRNTDPELVCFQLDCYWCVMGGEDPVEWLENYPNRFKLLHVKDRWIIGASGMLNWKNIFNTAKKIGIHDWFVELESKGNGRTQFEGVEESAKFLLAEDYVW